MKTWGALMEDASFLALIWRQLPEEYVSKLSDQDRRNFEREFLDQWRRGWRQWDIVEYARCSEELNPTLAETTALRRMDTIAARYHQPCEDETCPFCAPEHEHEICDDETKRRGKS